MRANPISVRRSLLQIISISSIAIIPSLLAGSNAFADEISDSDPALNEFRAPPPAARPRVWWHWMNGNISRDGIDKDLAWMKRIGVDGFTVFDAALETPQVVEQRLPYMSAPWQDAFRHSAQLAHDLSMEMGIAASPGWSETGGPWVAPVDAMKKVVWSETEVVGGKSLNIDLPQPPSIAGPFQKIGILAPPAGEKPKAGPDFYADTRVFAIPISREASSPFNPPQWTDASGNKVANVALDDEDYAKGIDIDIGPPERPTTLIASFSQPTTLRSAQLYAPRFANIFFEGPVRPILESSVDGRTWKKIADVPLTGVPTTVSFAPVTARHFRFVFIPKKSIFGFPTGKLKIEEMKFFAEARVNRFEQKAGFYQTRDYYAIDADVGDDTAGIDPASIVDLTDRMQSGRLTWTPPKGRWRIIRMGYSLTGTTNHPATAEATGLEVDKYDGSAVRRYLETYLDKYKAALDGQPFGDRPPLSGPC